MWVIVFSQKARLIAREYHAVGPAFPYKVAKSLEAKIYRNVDFDEWIDKKKGEHSIDARTAAKLLRIVQVDC